MAVLRGGTLLGGSALLRGGTVATLEAGGQDRVLTRAGVDRLREDVDRTAARLTALEAQLQKTTDSQCAADVR